MLCTEPRHWVLQSNALRPRGRPSYWGLHNLGRHIHGHGSFQELKSIFWIRSRFLSFLFYFYWLCNWNRPEGIFILTGESLMEQFQDVSDSWNKCKETNKPKHTIANRIEAIHKTTSYNLWDMEYLTRTLWSEGFWEDDRHAQIWRDSAIGGTVRIKTW